MAQLEVRGDIEPLEGTFGPTAGLTANQSPRLESAPAKETYALVDASRSTPHHILENFGLIARNLNREDQGVRDLAWGALEKASSALEPQHWQVIFSEGAASTWAEGLKLIAHAAGSLPEENYPLAVAAYVLRLHPDAKVNEAANRALDVLLPVGEVSYEVPAYPELPDGPSKADMSDWIFSEACDAIGGAFDRLSTDGSRPTDATISKLLGDLKPTKRITSNAVIAHALRTALERWDNLKELCDRYMQD